MAEETTLQHNLSENCGRLKNGRCTILSITPTETTCKHCEWEEPHPFATIRQFIDDLSLRFNTVEKN